MRRFDAIRDDTADQRGDRQLVTVLQASAGLFARQLVARQHYDMGRARFPARVAAGIED